jgi:hypothetical protein
MSNLPVLDAFPERRFFRYGAFLYATILLPCFFLSIFFLTTCFVLEFLFCVSVCVVFRFVFCFVFFYDFFLVFFVAITRASSFNNAAFLELTSVNMCARFLLIIVRHCTMLVKKPSVRMNGIFPDKMGF